PITSLQGPPIRPRPVATVIALCVLLASPAIRADGPKKEQTDEEIRRLLVGRWLGEMPGASREFSRGSTFYKKDGTFEARGRPDRAGVRPLTLFFGTWRVNNGWLDESSPGGRVSLKVLLIDDEKFAFRTPRTVDSPDSQRALWKRLAGVDEELA